MLVGLIRSRARLAHLALSPVPAVALTLIMVIVMALLAPLLTILGAPPTAARTSPWPLRSSLRPATPPGVC